MTEREELIELTKDIKREGFDKLMDYVLNKSDFTTAPASTRFHGSIPGGLLIHSLNVYKLLALKKTQEPFASVLADVSDESIKIIALMHDLCKTFFYTEELRNKKVYKENGSKKDANGRFDWETVKAYVVDDKVPYGHGEKSVMMIENYITLTPLERYAIRWHMGFTEPKENYNPLGAAIEKYPIILAIHEADLEATYLLEKDLKA